ncbi:MAG: PorV/PorQ family protein [Saprospiraceae bacterium]
MKKQLLSIGLCLFVGLSAISAQKYSNEFLAIGVGGRAHGMSGAQVALTDDITAVYWNPAGLSQITSPLQAGAMHAEWFGGVGKYDWIGFGKSLNREHNAYLAFSLIRLGIDNIPYTINLIDADGTINYDNVTEFSAADYAFMGSYARKLRNPAISVGGTVKVIRRVIGTFGGAWGFGADLGAQYRKGPLMLGIQGRDLTTTFNSWSFDLTDDIRSTWAATGNELPVSNTEITNPSIVLGAAYRFKLGKETMLTPALDFVWTTDGQRNVLISSKAISIDPRFGIEADYKKFLQLRVGVGNFQRVKNDFDPTKENLSMQPNFGVGIRFGRVKIDYALTDIGNVSAVQYSHIFSLLLDFKEKKAVGSGQ